MSIWLTSMPHTINQSISILSCNFIPSLAEYINLQLQFLVKLIFKVLLHSTPILINACIGPRTYRRWLFLNARMYTQKNANRPKTFTFQEDCTYTFREPKRFWKRAFLINTPVIHYNYWEKLLVTNLCQNKRQPETLLTWKTHMIQLALVDTIIC